MKFISVRELRATSAKVFGSISKDKEVVITSNGKPVAVMSAVVGGNLQDVLSVMRRARAMSAVESIQAASMKSGKDKMNLDEINSEISKSRRERSK